MSLVLKATDLERDAESICRIGSEFDPETLTPTQWLDRAHKTPAEWLTARLSAFVGDELIGYLYVRRSPTMKAGVFLSTIAVTKKLRRQGHGNVLAREAETQVKNLGGAKLFQTVREEFSEHPSFFERRGYKTALSLAESWLNLDEVSLDSASANSEMIKHGFSLLTWSQIGDSAENRSRLYQMHSEIEEDEPGTKIFGLTDRANFERETFGQEMCLADWLWILTKNDEWAGMHQIVRHPTCQKKAKIAYTGVRRPYRGKGMGLAMKTLGADTVRQTGVKNLMTHNDRTNQPMLDINVRMGYAISTGWLFMGKEVAQ